MTEILWYFFIYSFLGWCAEVVYAALVTREFVNRGFLNGLFCPIYGFGVLLVVYALEPVKDNLLLLFFGSVVLTSLIELVGGFLLEKLFRQKWWDYSDFPFNIGGYICPLFSMRWGIVCLVVVDRIHPLFASMVQAMPDTVSQVILWLLSLLFVADLFAAVNSILKLNEKLRGIDEVTEKIREASDSIGEGLATGTLALMERKRMLLESDLFGQKRLLKAFPRLRSLDHRDALDKLKQAVLSQYEKRTAK